MKAKAMGRSKGVTITVKVPVAWEKMTKQKKQKLRQIVGRDTRIIRSFLGVIEQNENSLLSGRNRTRIDDGALDRLTITAIRVTSKYPKRLTVPHNMKAKYPRCSSGELIECRRTAIALYESYLALKKRGHKKASRPCESTKSGRIPRWIYSLKFKLVESPSSVSHWWLDLQDSFDSALLRKSRHDRIRIPLKMSKFHISQIERGKVKALQIMNDRMGKWWIHFAVRLKEVPTLSSLKSNLPPAVLGIDLGIKKAVCTALVTPEKVRETRYFLQKDKARAIEKYDQLVAVLQSEMEVRRNNCQSYDNVAKKLKRLKSKRENISKDYDRILLRQLLDYIIELSEKYTLYVSLGRLKYIRRKAYRNNRSGRTLRRMINSWSFARITNGLKHQLSQLGWTVDGKKARFKIVSEAWTSSLCWKCGAKGRRPKQNHFICLACGHQTNADRNGAINIATRLIMLTDSLHSVRGRGKWVDAINVGKNPQLKSLLQRRSAVSHSKESAVVRFVQTDLLSFGDKSERSDNDPAVENTVEELSVVGNDTPTEVQEKEAGSVGGTVSR
ncbi:MAG: zinc ribbon domain-containing protein [Candidatus Thorarchaeota archaeon]